MCMNIIDIGKVTNLSPVYSLSTLKPTKDTVFDKNVLLIYQINLFQFS